MKKLLLFGMMIISLNLGATIGIAKTNNEKDSTKLRTVKSCDMVNVWQEKGYMQAVVKVFKYEYKGQERVLLVNDYDYFKTLVTAEEKEIFDDLDVCEGQEFYIRENLFHMVYSAEKVNAVWDYTNTFEASYIQELIEIEKEKIDENYYFQNYL